jgi:hypothetical protein
VAVLCENQVTEIHSFLYPRIITPEIFRRFFFARGYFRAEQSFPLIINLLSCRIRPDNTPGSGRSRVLSIPFRVKKAVFVGFSQHATNQDGYK